LLRVEHAIALEAIASRRVDLGVRPGAHIFVGSKAPWFEITDKLPQFKEFPS